MGHVRHDVHHHPILRGKRKEAVKTASGAFSTASARLSTLFYLVDESAVNGFSRIRHLCQDLLFDLELAGQDHVNGSSVG